MVSQVQSILGKIDLVLLLVLPNLISFKEVVNRSDTNNNLPNWKKLKFSSYVDDLGSNMLL